MLLGTFHSFTVYPHELQLWFFYNTRAMRHRCTELVPTEISMSKEINGLPE